LFGGYLTYRADALVRLLAHTPAGARKLALRMCALLPVSDEKIGLEYKIRRFLEGSLLAPDYAHCYWNGTFTPHQKKTFFLAAEADGVGALFDGLMADQNLTGLNRYLWFDQAYYLPDDILYKCDRMSMAQSLEVRPPFLDHRIVEFAASLPERLKIRGARQKVLLRELMKGKLPAVVLARRKEGFDIPAHEWLRTALRPLLEETLRPEIVAATGIFDAAQIQSLVRNHLERRVNLGFHLWGLLILFLWMRRWRIQTGPPTQTEATRPALSGVLSSSS
jgi:asparagine synthase (glutamine-hydrolysing)